MKPRLTLLTVVQALGAAPNASGKEALNVKIVTTRITNVFIDSPFMSIEQGLIYRTALHTVMMPVQGM